MLAIAALAISFIQAETAECRVLVAVERGVVTRVGLACPPEVAEASDLQAYADQVAAAFQTPLTLRDLQVTGVTEAVRFTWADGRWTLHEPASFLSSAPRYPEQAARRNVEARCDMRVQVGAGGAAEDIDAVCRGFRRNGSPVRQSGFESAAMEAVGRYRWFAPLDPERRCALASLTFELGDGEGDQPHFERPVAGAPQCP